MAIEWIMHKGKKILYFEAKECTTERKFLAALQELKGVVLGEEPGSVRKLTNYFQENEKSATRKVLNYIVALGQDPEYVSRLHNRRAVIGLTGVREIYYNTYVFFSNDKSHRLFKNMNEALDYLVSD